MFFNLGALFLKIHIFEVVIFFPRLVLTQSTQSTIFSVVGRVYNIHIFDEACTPLLVTIPMKTGKECISCFHGNHCQGNKFLHHNHVVYQSKFLSLKNWS